MEYYVYIYLNPLKKGNFVYKKFSFEYEPFYVGLGKNRRIDRHITLAKTNQRKTLKDNIILKILKQGAEPIRFKLYENISLESAKRLETYLIKLIGRRNLKTGTLANLTDGGDGSKGCIFTEDMKKAKSLLIKKMWNNGIFDNRKMDGENNHFFNKKHTNESRKKMSESLKGKYVGELNPNYNHKWTQEMKEHLSKLKKGTMCGDANPTKRPEVRKNISISKMADKNPQACRFTLINPDDIEYNFVGGVKNKLKEFNLSYNGFYKKLSDHTENKDGWKLYNLGKINNQISPKGCS
jgi:group I intron endonuclease